MILLDETFTFSCGDKECSRQRFRTLRIMHSENCNCRNFVISNCPNNQEVFEYACDKCLDEIFDSTTVFYIGGNRTNFAPSRCTKLRNTFKPVDNNPESYPTTP